MVDFRRALENKRNLDRLERAAGNPNPVFAYTDGLPPPDAASEVNRLREALERIRDAHIPDQPAASGDDELEWAQRHVARLRRIALDALSG